ncbi:MAG: hypothetical protein MJ002_02780, partial [Paludibacteraceae bacterium]|nr:hypothetical protein [Paludibacteraceae bacterium]
MKRFLTSVLALALAWSAARADSWTNYGYNSTEGQEFYVTFMDNNAPEGAGTLTLQLFMAARRPANVTVTANSTGQQYAVTVDSFVVWSLPVPSDAYSTMSNVVTSKSLTITSDAPIALFTSCFSDTKGDASLVMPSGVLGREYVVQSSEVNEYLPNFAIIATEPGTTTVTVTPSVSLINNTSDEGGATGAPLPAESSYTVDLEQGQVYYASTDSLKYDVSGTRISASQRVAMFNGCQSSIMIKQPRITISSHISHQAQPLLMVGTRYPLVKFEGQVTSVVKVTAVFDDTYIYQNGTLIDSLDAFESRTINWGGSQKSMLVETSKQAYCYQYMFGSMSEYGSPAMVFATDLQQAVPSVKFSTFTIDIYNSQTKTIVRDTDIVTFVNIVASANAAAGTMLDNVPVGNFNPVDGLPGYAYTTVEVSQGVHEITNNMGGFLATVYGYDTVEIPSYAFNPGFNCIHQDAYMLFNGERVSSAFVVEGADHLWHFNTSSVVKGDYDSIQWYDYSPDGGGGELGEYKYTGDVWNAALGNPHDHTIYMKVYRHSPLTGEVVEDVVSVDLYCCVNTHDIIPLPACQTDTVVVFGKKISCDTLEIGRVYPYTESYTTYYGCDSVVTYYLQVINRQDSCLYKTICQGDTCRFREHDFTQAGTYYVLDSVGHCYYNDTLNLSVIPSYRFTKYDTICFDEQPYKWRRDIRSDTAGVITIHDSLKTVLGCDSLYELILTIGEVYLTTDTVNECDNHVPYEWHGREFTESGVYYDSLSSRLGCDSVHRLLLTVSPSYHFTDTMTVCSNDNFVWRDSLYNGFEPGRVVIYDSLTTSQGCDSVYEMRLTVKPADISYTDMTMCDNETLTWRGHRIYGSAVKVIPLSAEVVDTGFHLISDSLVNVRGCDSIYHLRLTVNKSHYEVTNVDICQGESYRFDNRDLTWRNDIPGVHDSTVHYFTELGCDSMLHLLLTVNPVYDIWHYDTVCGNTPFRWKYHDVDTIINQRTAGTYDYRFYRRTKVGCDSVNTLRLTVLDTTLVSSTANIPDKGSYVWDNRKYGGTKCTERCDMVLPVSASPYSFRRVYTAANGCDSIMTLTIRVFPTYEFSTDITTCQHDSYQFNGKTWDWMKDVAGSHDTICRYRTVAGYDSIWNVHLKVNPVYMYDESKTTCVNEPYDWQGHRRVLSNLKPGVHTFYDSLKSVVGYCDSIYKLTLTVRDTLSHVDYLTMCDNETMVWDGQLFYCNANTPVPNGTLCPARKEPYTFEHRYTSVLTHCDSIKRLVLYVKKSYLFETDTMLCAKDGFAYRDVVYTQSGTYHDSLKTVDGCDSVYILRLSLDAITKTKQYIGICEGESFYYRGKPIDKPGVYVDSLITVVGGCDSVLEINFDILPTYHIYDTIQMCDGSSYEWHGRNITGSGTYFDSLVTRSGCDSIYQLYVNVTHNFHNIEYDTLCSNTVYQWRNKFITEGGTYFDSISTQSGCDSVYELRLTMSRSYVYEQFEEMCHGGSFYFRGRRITAAGTYYDTLTTKHGCDSIIKLVLNYAPTYHFRDTMQICDGDSFDFRGKTYSHAGTYFDSLRTVSGCDSIYEIFVKVIPEFHNIEYDTLCSNKTYHWRGKWLTESGVYFDSLKSSNGCDSVYEMRLTMYNPTVHEEYVEVCQGGSFDFRGRRITQPGTYYDTLINVHGCDSIYKLVFNVAKTYYFRDTTQICDGETYNFRGRPITKAGIYR